MSCRVISQTQAKLSRKTENKWKSSLFGYKNLGSRNRNIL